MEAGFDWDNEDAAMESQLLASAKLYTHKTQGTPVWYTRPLATGGARALWGKRIKKSKPWEGMEKEKQNPKTVGGAKTDKKM